MEGASVGDVVMARSGYAGLSRRERAVTGALVGIGLVLAALWLPHFWNGRWPDAPARSVAALKVFDVPPPPPPPEPRPTPTPPPAIRITAKAAAGPARPHHPAPADAGAPPPVPIPIVPVAISPTLPTLLSPSEGSGAITGSGPGLAAGSGSGGGGGDTGAGRGIGIAPAPLLTRAAWVKPPTLEDAERAWPPGAHDLAAPVRVELVCSVRKSGRPFDCHVRSENPPGKGFGAASIRMLAHALVRPVLSDGRSTGRDVIIPLMFNARPH